MPWNLRHRLLGLDPRGGQGTLADMVTFSLGMPAGVAPEDVLDRVLLFRCGFRFR